MTNAIDDKKKWTTMKTYTIIGGADGTGKTSLLGVLRTARHDLGRVLSDESGAEECLAAGVCFTQETTLSGHRPAVMARRAADAGYRVRLYYVGLDTVEECLARIRNRVARGGHGIPEEDVRRRFAGRFAALAAVLPYCTKATVYDNGNGFRAVAEYRNGELLPIGSFSPAWLDELRRYLAEQ